MKCDFSATTREEGDVRLDDQVIPKKDEDIDMLVIELKSGAPSFWWLV
jgi:hypothetical protein